MKKCDAGIIEILNYCDEQARKRMNTEKATAHKTAPEYAPRVRRTGLEGLKNYVGEKKA
jgi:hypothetical protein